MVPLSRKRRLRLTWPMASSPIGQDRGRAFPPSDRWLERDKHSVHRRCQSDCRVFDRREGPTELLERSGGLASSSLTNAAAAPSSTAPPRYSSATPVASRSLSMILKIRHCPGAIAAISISSTAAAASSGITCVAHRSARSMRQPQLVVRGGPKSPGSERDRWSLVQVSVSAVCRLRPSARTARPVPGATRRRKAWCPP